MTRFWRWLYRNDPDAQRPSTVWGWRNLRYGHRLWKAEVALHETMQVVLQLRRELDEVHADEARRRVQRMGSDPDAYYAEAGAVALPAARARARRHIAEALNQHRS